MNRKNRYLPLPNRVVQLAEILDVQGNDPSTESDPYMIGLFNGLEMGLAIMEQREPSFKVVPKKNLKSLIDKFSVKKSRPFGRQVN